ARRARAGRALYRASRRARDGDPAKAGARRKQRARTGAGNLYWARSETHQSRGHDHARASGTSRRSGTGEDGRTTVAQRHVSAFPLRYLPPPPRLDKLGKESFDPARVPAVIVVAVTRGRTH